MADSKSDTKPIKMLHPDHATRDDGGVYYAESEAEAMQLSTRGYSREDSGTSKTGGGAKTAPKSGDAATSGSSSST
ncbi:hypothetical protein WY02_03530 [Pseudonocardia sp. AL041005-10]|jgi:hypothetical protein|nr:hypothetical protein [Pseudonocardia sp. AL041005-10]ALE77673.1 hypothetical protein WY02_03530 [Pseudonocardia sp. AL041005-10]